MSKDSENSVNEKIKLINISSRRPTTIIFIAAVSTIIDAVTSQRFIDTVSTFTTPLTVTTFHWGWGGWNLMKYMLEWNGMEIT